MGRKSTLRFDFSAAIRGDFGEYPSFPLSSRRFIEIAVFLGLLALAGAPTTASADASTVAEESTPEVDTAQILGHWQRGKGEAIIEISELDGVYSGVIVWSQKRPETVGIEVFRELRYDSEDGEWHGRAFSIKREREVPIDIRLPGQDQLELTAHILIFTKDVDFSRVSSSKLAALRANKDL